MVIRVNKSIFEYIITKHRKQIFKLKILNYLMLIVLFFSFLTVLFSFYNINDNLLNNSQLKIISIDGYNDLGEGYEYDINEIKKMENVASVFYDYPYVISFAIDQDIEMLTCLPLNEVTESTINYSGEYDVLLPESYKNHVVNIIELENYQEYTVGFYEGEGQMFLRDYCYVSEDIYDYISQFYVVGDNYISNKNLLVLVDETEHIGDFVKTFNLKYDEEDVFIYYQSAGLENLFSSSKISQYLIIAFEAILILSISVIYHNAISSLFSILNKDIVSLYLNGLSRSKIVSNLSKTIIAINTKSYIVVFVFNLFLNLSLYLSPYSLFSKKIFIITNIFVFIIITINTFLIRKSIKRLMKKNMSNTNITSYIKN